jgi:hypothetical protein
MLLLIAKWQENRMDTSLFGKWSVTAHKKYCCISFFFFLFFPWFFLWWGGGMRAEGHGVYSLWLQGNIVWCSPPPRLFLFKMLNLMFCSKIFGHDWLKHSICKSSR